MSDDTAAQSAALPTPIDALPARPDADPEAEVKVVDAAPTETPTVAEPVESAKVDAQEGEKEQESTSTEAPSTGEVNPEVTTTDAVPIDAETKPDVPAKVADAIGDAADDTTVDTPTSASKSKARRKSSGVPEHKSKKLNKKQSKAKMSHTDALPGDHFFIKLKGYPLWPGVICDEAMLPESLIKTRPVTAARPDGTYRADYEDGGKNVIDRTFPVMYLSTNEFGWIPNTDLQDLDFDEVSKVTEQGKMRKDLFWAHQLAAEKHDLTYYKQILREFQEARQAEADAKAAAKAEKAANKKSKSKSKAQVSAEDDEEPEDIEMADAGEGGEEGAEKHIKSKKRKAEADADESADTPRAESAKKPKIKLNTSSTPKPNGNATPKSSIKKESTAKPKAKPKKAATNGESAAAPKEPESTPEEKRQKREKEILFLRHKLQKGLLAKEQLPKEEEMKQMSEFITKLEGYAELEVSIIRATKINKVLKAIIKIDVIPKEAEFKFKDRSNSLLDKWNKILEAETPGTSSATPAAATNGTPAEATNGVTATTEDPDVKTDAIETKTEDASAPAEPALKVTPAVENDAPVATETDVAMTDAPEKTEPTASDEVEPTATEPVTVEAAT